MLSLQKTRRSRSHADTFARNDYCSRAADSDSVDGGRNACAGSIYY